MGKHAASGSSSHPLVAAALAQRTVEGGAHRDGRAPASEGALGWPGQSPSPGSGGLGWPADVAPTGTGSAGTGSGQQPADDQAEEEPAPPAERRGWRRFFGQDPAA